MKLFRNIFLSFYLCASLGLFAQNTPDFLVLKHLGNELGDRTSQTVRQRASDSLLKILVPYVKQTKINTDSLQHIANISVLTDKDVMIATWAVMQEFETYHYYGFIRQYDRKNKEVSLIILNDVADSIKKPQFQRLNAQQWFGAIYYKMIPVEKKNSTYYMLLGWNGHNMLSSKKIIDVLYFDDGAAIFGSRVFRNVPGMGKATRMIFEYTKKAIMSLEYNEEKKAIVFDHLAPPSSQMNGMHQFYGPDLSFDALILKDGLWYFKRDYDARMPKTKNDRFYHAPQ